MTEYYTREVDENGNITFKLVDFDQVKICGYTLKEVMDILNGLEIERITEIKMTMENLQTLFYKVIEEQREMEEKILGRIFKKVSDK